MIKKKVHRDRHGGLIIRPITPLEDTLIEVINNQEEGQFPNKYVPFVPVVSCSYMGIYGFMPTVHNDKKMDHTHSDSSATIDDTETQKCAHFVSVEDGDDIFDILSKENEESIAGWDSELANGKVVAVCVPTDELSVSNIHGNFHYKRVNKILIIQPYSESSLKNKTI